MPSERTSLARRSSSRPPRPLQRFNANAIVTVLLFAAFLPLGALSQAPPEPPPTVLPLNAASAEAGAFATYEVKFTPTSPWGANDLLAVTFPEGYDLRRVASTANVASVVASCTSTNAPVTVEGQRLQLLRNPTDAPCVPPPGVEIKATFTNIRNPRVSGPTGSFDVKTEGANAAEKSAVAAPVEIQPAAMDAPVVMALDPTPGAQTTLRIAFTTRNPWPADGRLEMDFPSGFALAPTRQVTSLTPGCASGQFLAEDQGALVISRSHGEECPPGSIMLDVSGVGLPAAATTQTVSLRTQQSSLLLPIDAGSAPIVVAPPLTSESATPTTPATGVPSEHVVRFTSPVAWEGAAKLVLSFAGGFGLGTAGSITVQGTCPAGTSATSTSTGNNLVLTRSAGGACAPGEVVVRIPSLTNPASAASRPVLIRLQDAAGTDLAAGSAMVTLQPNALASGSVTPSVPIAGALSTYPISFVTTNPWAAEGRFRATFPAGYIVNGVTATILSQTPACQSGWFAVTPHPETNSVTGVRGGSSQECPGGRAVTVRLDNVRNPGFAGPKTILVRTESAMGDPVDVAQIGTALAPATMPVQIGANPAGVGATAAISFSFTPVNEWPADGRLSLAFPAAFDLSGASFGSMSRCASNQETQVLAATNSVLVVRDATTACAPGSLLTITLQGIVNPSQTGTIEFPSSAVRTQTADGADIDVGSGALVIASNAIQSPTLVPAVDDANALTAYTFAGTLSNVWAHDGRMLLTFPSAYDLAAVPSQVQADGCDGTFGIAKTATELTITRAGGSDCARGTALEILLPGVRNPGAAGAYLVHLETRGPSGGTLDAADVEVLIGVRDMAAAMVSLQSPKAGAKTSYEFSFLPSAAWPGDGEFVAAFPADYTFDPAVTVEGKGCNGSGATPDGTGNGNFGANVDAVARKVTVTRSGGSTCAASSSVPLRLKLVGIISPPVSGPASIDILTRTSGANPQNIEQGSVTAMIQPSTLTVVSLTPENRAAGATTTYVLTLRLSNPWPADGLLRIAMPAGFTLGEVAAAPVGGCASGPLEAVVDGSVLLVARDSAAACPKDTPFSISLSQIQNPSTPGESPPILLQVQRNDQRPIDEGQATVAIGAGPLLNPLLAPQDNKAGALTTYALAFTPSNPWPANGLFTAKFPANVGIAQVASSVAATGCQTGSFAATVSGQHVTVTRTGGSDCDANVRVTLTLGNVRNPPMAFLGSVILNTTTADGETIDTALAALQVLPGQLGGLQATPASNLAGANGAYTFQFTPANPWPKDGTLLVTFPEGYSFGDVVATATGCASSSLARRELSATSIAFDRTAQSACNSALTLSLSNIGNPGHATPARDISLTTQTKNPGTTIDTGSVAVEILAASLQLTVTATNPTAGASSDYLLSFTNTNPWPADGRLWVQFPPGFDLTSAEGGGATHQSCNGGSFTPTIEGQVVRVDRGDGGDACSGPAQYLIRKVRNPDAAGAAGALLLKTQTQGGAEDLGAASANLAIVAGTLGSTSILPPSAPVDTGEPLEFAFRLANEWKSTGRFRATLPVSFDLTGPLAVTAITCNTGSFQPSVSGRELTVTRAGGAHCPVDTLVRLRIEGVQTGTTAGSFSIPIRTLTPAGADLDVGSVTLQVTPGPFSAAHSLVTSQKSQLRADGASTSTITVLLKDAHGNRLVQSGGTGLVQSDRGTVGPTTNHNDGSYTATLTSGTQAGMATVTARVGSTTLTSSAAVSFVTGMASGLTSTLTPLSASLVADGVSHTTIVIQLKDAFGNINATGGAEITLSTDLGTIQDRALDRGDGTYAAVLTSGLASGTATVSALLWQTPSQPEPIEDTATVQFLAGGPTQMKAADPTTINDLVAAGQRTLRVRVVDDHENPVPGSRIQWSVVSGSGSLSPEQSQTDAQGISSTVLTAGPSRGTITVRATNASLAGGPITFVVNTISGAPASLEAVGPTALDAVAGATRPLQVIVRDAHGNPVASETVGFEVTQGAGTLSPATATSGPDGVATTVLSTDPEVGLNEITAAHASVPTPVRFSVETTPGPVSFEESTLTASVPTLVVGTEGPAGLASVVLRLRDEHGNPLDDSVGDVAFTTSRGTLIAPIDRGDGTYAVLLQVSTQAGPSIVSAALMDGATVVESFEQTARVQFLPAAPQRILHHSPTPKTDVDAGTEETIQARVVDAFDNPVPGVFVAWSTKTGGKLSSPKSVTAADGVASIVLTTANATGKNLVRATNATFDRTGIEFSITTIVGEASKLVPVGPVLLRNINAGSTVPIKVKATDLAGNPIRGVFVAWSTESTLGELSPSWALTDTKGVAATSLKTNKTVGTIVVSARNDNFTDDQESNPDFTIITRPAYTMTAAGVLPTDLVAGNETLVKVLIKDQHGAVVAGVRVNWSAPSGGGTVNPTFSLSGADGIAQTRLTSGNRNGTNVVSASNASLLASPLNQTVRTIPGPATTLRIAGTPTTILRDVPFVVTAEILDSKGNVAPRAGTATLSIASGPSGKLNGTLTRSVTAGVARFADLRFAAAGNYQLLVTYQSLQNTTGTIVVSAPAVTAGPAPVPNPATATEVAAVAKPFFVPEVEAARLPNSSVLVSWTAPPGQSVGGYMIWRSASPFSFVGEADAKASSFIDSDSMPDHTYRYAVTFYLKTGEGYFQTQQALNGLSGDALLPTSATVDERASGKSFLGVNVGPSWAPWVGGLALLVVGAALAVFFVLRRRRADEEDAFVVVPQAPPGADPVTPEAPPASGDEAYMPPPEPSPRRQPPQRQARIVHGSARDSPMRMASAAKSKARKRATRTRPTSRAKKAPARRR